MLNIKELLVGHPIRLRYVHRYSTCRILSPESVAEHSFFVAFYSLAVYEWCKKNLFPDFHVEFSALSLPEIMKRCLLHDLDEAATGDIPRMFKYSDPRLKGILDSMAAQGFSRVINEVVTDSEVQADWLDFWKNAKDESVNGRIVAFVDYLSVIAFTCEEMRSSNFTIQEHVEALEPYARTFDDPGFNFIRPLVKEAEQLLREKVMDFGK